MAAPPTKSELLLMMAEQASRSGRLLMTCDGHKNAGRLRMARVCYDELIESLRLQLELGEKNNELFPETPFDVKPIVGQMVNALLTQVDVVETLGDFAEGDHLRDRALNLSETYLSKADVAERRRQRAASFVSRGRFHEALDSLYEARELFEERKDAIKIASVVADIASILEWLGDYERALEEVRRTLALLRQRTGGQAVGPEDFVSPILEGDLSKAEETVNLLRIQLELEQTEARADRRLARFDEAERLFRAIYPRVPAIVAEAGIGFHLAALEVDRGRFREGMAALHRLEPFFTGLARPKLGVLRSCQAEAMLGLGNPKEALQYAEEACTELRQHRDMDSLWKSQWCRARSLEALEEKDRALRAYNESVETIDELRKAPLGYRLDSLYLKDKVPVFSDGIRLACSLGDADTVCRLVECIKSRALTATLSVPRTAGYEESGRELAARIDALSRRIDAIEYKSYAGETGGTAALEALCKERESLLERARIADPRWRTLSEPIRFDLASLLSNLQARKQSALSIHVDRDTIYTVLLWDGICRCGHVPLRDKTVKALDAYRLNLLAVNPVRKDFDPAALVDLAIDRLVPEALLCGALGAASLVIVPHGPLHLLPWAALRLGDARLFEISSVGILPNLSCLTPMSVGPAGPKRLALIGSPDYHYLKGLRPLRMCDEELQIVADLYRDALVDKPRLGADATQDSFRHLIACMDSDGDILHVACHGTFPVGDPMGAGLLLSDGKVDAAEIMRFRIKGNEVILSACSSGYRATQAHEVTLTGDDILGLPGAFLEAGARSVLVSIPPAREDAALSFMTRYHEYRVKGSSPLASLQATQLGMLEQGEFDPHLWAGFTVYGCR